MTAFTLKIIALASMLIDHVGVFGGPDFFRLIGRLAFPIFVYLLAEGFRHTKSPEQFLARLLAFAVISEIPFDIAFNERIDFFADTNIFYTLFLGGAAITVYRAMKKFHGEEIVAVFAALGFAWLAEIFGADYGAFGVAFIFLMYVTPTKLRLATMAIMCILGNSGVFILAALASVLPVAFYNGNRGLKLKWLFYTAYPVHLLVLTFLDFLLRNG